MMYSIYYIIFTEKAMQKGTIQIMDFQEGTNIAEAPYFAAIHYALLVLLLVTSEYIILSTFSDYLFMCACWLLWQLTTGIKTLDFIFIRNVYSPSHIVQITNFLQGKYWNFYRISLN